MAKLDEETVNATVAKTYDYLVNRAQRGRGPIVFGDLADRLGMEGGPGNVNWQTYLDALDRISEQEHLAGRPPLTALVLQKESRPNQFHEPVASVWPALARDGYDLTNRPVAWALALSKVYGYWHNPASPENNEPDGD